MHTNEINNVYELPNMKKVIQYYHAVAGFPSKPIWLKAINTFFSTWPMLTNTAVAFIGPCTKC